MKDIFIPTVLYYFDTFHTVRLLKSSKLCISFAFDILICCKCFPPKTPLQVRKQIIVSGGSDLENMGQLEIFVLQFIQFCHRFRGCLSRCVDLVKQDNFLCHMQAFLINFFLQTIQ